MNYALIENGVVTNLIYLHPDNVDDFPGAVPIGDLPVAIGDTYSDEVFYHEGVQVLSAVDVAKQDTEDMRAALNLLGVNANE